MLEINQLTKSFGVGSNKLQVLKGIDMEMKTGELVALMGPSGCGKSTLLNIIGGLLPGDSGKITLKAKDYGLKGPSSVVDVRRELVGWIFQDFHLLNHLSALDNVAMALELSGIESKVAENRAAEALNKVGLGDRMHHIPEQLSGGQQQRVAIARAIAGNRPLLLADEPTGNLDSKNSNMIIDELCKITEENHSSLILATHDLNVANKMDLIFELSNKKLRVHNDT